MGLRDAILGAEDLPREQVPTPEWEAAGVPEVTVRGMSAAERDAFEMSLTVPTQDGRRVPNPQMRNIRSSFVVKLVIDEAGNRVFEDKDAKALGDKSALVLDRIWDTGRKLSGMLTDEENDEENPSSGDQEDTSSSDSPSPSASLTPIG